MLCFLLIGNPYLLSQNFFPLKVGNKYQIKDSWYHIIIGPGGGPYSGTRYDKIEITKDTLISLTPFYKILGYSPFSKSSYYMFDSIFQKLFVKVENDDTIRLAIDFNSPKDSHYISYLRGYPLDFISAGLKSDILFGDTTITYSTQCNEGSSYNTQTYYFAHNIGLYNYKSVSFSGNSRYDSDQRVISAIIGSNIFNPIVAKIDSIYPIKDRPINTFPFVITVKYSATYSVLIDSFSILANHVRVDSIINSQKFNVSVTSPSINLYFSGLNVGDKIRLKAFIRDKSIFSNIDYYPDSGWVTMTVLPSTLGIDHEYLNSEHKIQQNYPNPFNSSTLIRWQLQVGSHQTLKVYDVLGNEVTTLVDEYKPAGSYEVEFYAEAGHGSGITNLVSGIYFYQLKAGKFVQTRKMIYLK